MYQSWGRACNKENESIFTIICLLNTVCSSKWTAIVRPGVHSSGGGDSIPAVRGTQPRQQERLLAEGEGQTHPHRGQGDLHQRQEVQRAAHQVPDLWPGDAEHQWCGDEWCWQVPVSGERSEQDIKISGAGGGQTSGTTSSYSHSLLESTLEAYAKSISS